MKRRKISCYWVGQNYYTLFFTCLLTFYLFCSSLFANQQAATPVQSGYLHHLPEKTCSEVSESQDTWQYLQRNTAFLSNDAYDYDDDKDELDNEGLCFGLVCAYLQATLNEPDTRQQLSQSLEICSQNANTHSEGKNGWDFSGRHWSNLQQAMEHAQQQYKAYRQAYGLSDNETTFETFSRTNDEAARLLKTLAWMQSVYDSQNRQRCTYDIHSGNSFSGRASQKPTIVSTQGWPVALTKASTIEFLRELKKRPVPAHYLLFTASHSITLSLENDKITLFDQNAPCYFKQAGLEDSDELAADLFHALYTRPGCRVTVNADSIHYQCGVSTMLTVQQDENESIQQQKDTLKTAHPFVVVSLCQVFPENTPPQTIQSHDVNLSILLDDFAYLYPVPTRTTDSEGYTRLHLASRDGNISRVRQLLEEGESPGLRSSANILNQPGRTALELAQARNHLDIIRLLQSYNTDDTDDLTHFLGEAQSDAIHLYQSHWPVDRQPVPESPQKTHWETVQKHDSASVGQYYHSSCVGSGGSFEFRKAVVAIGRGEDPVSKGIERTVQGAVKISYEHFPEETRQVLNGLAATSETIDAVVNYADKATGGVISKHWDSLDQATKDELAGYGKILSVMVPPARVRELASVVKIRDSEKIKDFLEKTEIGRATKGKTEQRISLGGFRKAEEDFGFFSPLDIKEIKTQYGIGKTGRLESGHSITLRPGSSDGRPTLEIRNPNNGRGVEVRYDD
ncbi:ankyrin repeat domain-containing protein [Endozoicomonas numazuensis]|uniref:ankyrin repeat domain-containing protein n=1 Tax=Endozoicomonas numazuensis TaxID=1137799 RepID=UPI00069155B6|nr:ankyrin repeat domain-containing protein [Endozoicomonas numazuensis]